MTNFIIRSALVCLVALVCMLEQAHAAKRRPTGRDWIGGDFSQPATIIFRRGGHGGGIRHVHGGAVHHHASAPVRQPDQPPKLLDRLEVRAPANYGANTRKQIGHGIERFEIMGGTLAYGLDGAARLWRVTIGTQNMDQIGQSVIHFHAAEGGPLYVVEKDGTLWRVEGDGSNRTFLDHEVADFRPIDDVVYVLGKDRRLWRLHADSKGRDPVDENVAAFQPINSTIVFVLGTDGALWRENGTFRNRVKVAQPVAAFEYVANGDTTYAITPDRILWRQQGTNKPEQVDHDVAAFHTVDADGLYVLATDGRLWQERGGRSKALLVDGDLAVKSGGGAFQFVVSHAIDEHTVYVLDRKHSLWVESMPARGFGK